MEGPAWLRPGILWFILLFYGSNQVPQARVRVQVIYLYFHATFILQSYVTVLYTDIGLLILPQEFHCSFVVGELELLE